MKKKVNLRIICSCLGVFIPFFLVVLLVHEYAINAPFWDEWGHTVVLLKEYVGGTLDFHDLYKQHNVHRFFTPRVIWLAMVFISGQWNNLYSMWASVGISASTGVALYMLLRRTVPVLRKNMLPWASVAIAWIVFSIRQWENWLWGLQMSVFLHIAMMVATILFLSIGASRRPRAAWFFAGAIIAATLGTFSYGSGTVVWIVGAVLLFSLRRFHRQFFLWCIAAIVCLGAYSIGYEGGRLDTAALLTPTGLWTVMEYMMVYIGAPYDAFPVTAAKYGGVLLTGIWFSFSLWVFTKKKEWWEQIAPWSALGLFSFGAAMLSAISRFQLGIGQAMTSRYRTVSQFMLIAVVVFGSIALDRFWQSKNEYRKPIVLVTGVVLLVVLSVHIFPLRQSLALAQKRHHRIETGVRCINELGSRGVAECRKKIHPGNIDDQLTFMRAQQWGSIQPLEKIGTFTVVENEDTPGTVESLQYDKMRDIIHISGELDLDAKADLVVTVGEEVVGKFTINKREKNQNTWTRTVYLWGVTPGDQLPFMVYKKNSDGTLSPFAIEKKEYRAISID